MESQIKLFLKNQHKIKDGYHENTFVKIYHIYVRSTIFKVCKNSVLEIIITVKNIGKENKNNVFHNNKRGNT